MTMEMVEWLTRVGLTASDVLNQVPCPEAAHLVPVGLDCHGRDAFLAPAAAEAWHRLQVSARAAGVELRLVSAFRSYAYQAKLWEKKRQAGQTPAQIRRVLAVPGFSQHHSGCAIDLGAPQCTDLSERFEATTEFRWLAGHAATFGFVMPYGRDHPSGVIYEPWHWCFEGT